MRDRMREQMTRLSAATLLVTILVTAGLASEEPRYSELPNFHKINNRLYRGGQPAKGGLKKLAELGVKTIINLRGENRGLEEQEAVEARTLGLNYYNIPMPELSRPTDEQMNQVLGIIDSPASGPVFIHCRRGSDRTGTVVACYRISTENWDARKATTEARRYGMSWVEFGMRGYISDFYVRQSNSRGRQPSAPAFKPSPSVEAPQPVPAEGATAH